MHRGEGYSDTCSILAAQEILVTGAQIASRMLSCLWGGSGCDSNRD